MNTNSCIVTIINHALLLCQNESAIKEMPFKTLSNIRQKRKHSGKANLALIPRNPFLFPPGFHNHSLHISLFQPSPRSLFVLRANPPSDVNVFEICSSLFLICILTWNLEHVSHRAISSRPSMSSTKYHPTFCYVTNKTERSNGFPL